jgi:hypothetical protein
MEWSKQTEEAVKNWADIQKRVWETWIAPLKGTPGGVGPEAGSAYRQALGVWENAVKQALDAQLVWTRQWADTLGAAKGTSDPAASCARSTHEMMRAWTEAHKQLWETWFSTLRQLEPSGGAGADLWDKQARSVLNAWEEAIKAAQQSMADWSSQWSAKV